MIVTFFRDFAYALRGFVRTPTFTLVIVVTLALGVGANTAVFSLVNGLLLKPLPYPESDRLVVVWNDNRRAGIPRDGNALANLADYRRESQSFREIGAFAPIPLIFTGAGEAMTVNTVFVTSEFIPVVGVQPLLGRSFSPEEGRPGAGNVCVLSHRFWQQYAGGDLHIIGKPLEFSHRRYTVVGVMPPGFEFPPGADVWINVAAYFGDSKYYVERSRTFFSAIGRLRPGVSLASARSEMTAIAARLEHEYVDDEGYGVLLVPLREEYFGEIGALLRLVLAAAGFTLLIACVNLASLLLARGAARQRELAVRVALGASRARLVAQLLTETLALVLFGGLAGVMLASLALKLFVAANPFGIWKLDQVTVDGRVLGFACLVSAGIAALFGLMPALQASRHALTARVSGDGPRVTGGRTSARLRELLVAAQVALAVSLMLGAGLMIRSARRLQAVDLGFSPGQLLTFRDVLPSDPYAGKPETRQFQEQLLARMRNLPGVVAAAACNYLFVEETITDNIQIEGNPLTASGRPIEVGEATVSLGYFSTLGVPLRRGRLFSELDGPTSEPAVIVNETMATRFWPGEDPIGKRIKIPSVRGWMSIIGVVADHRRLRVETVVSPEIYRLMEQGGLRNAQIVLRTAVEPLTLAAAVRQSVRDLDKNVPVEKLQPMAQLIAERFVPRVYASRLLGVFAAIALALAAVGIFGMLSYLVRQRTRELGIRIALGARPWDVRWLILSRGLTLTLVGLAIGLIGSLAFFKLLSRLLFGVRPLDPLNLVTVVGVLAGVALCACYFPSRRATRVAPMDALRSE